MTFVTLQDSVHDKLRKVDSVHETLDNLRLSGVLAVVLTYLASIVIERPRLCYLHGNKLYDDVHRSDSIEVISKVSTYSE